MVIIKNDTHGELCKIIKLTKAHLPMADFTKIHFVDYLTLTYSLVFFRGCLWDALPFWCWWEVWHTAAQNTFVKGYTCNPIYNSRKTKSVTQWNISWDHKHKHSGQLSAFHWKWTNSTWISSRIILLPVHHMKLSPHETLSIHWITVAFRRVRYVYNILYIELFNTEEKQWHLSPWTSSLTITAPGNTALSGNLEWKTPLFYQESHLHILEWPKLPPKSQSGFSSLHTHDKT